MYKLGEFITKQQILGVFLLVLLGGFLYEIRGILVSLFIAYIVMAALIPAVSLLQRLRFPKILAVLITYLLTLSLVMLLILPLIPFFVSQIESLFFNFPVFLDRAANGLGISLDVATIQTYVSTELALIGKNAFSLTSKVFGGIFSVLTILVVSFYLLLGHESFRKEASQLFPKNHQKKVMTTTLQVEEKLGAWLRGQIVLSFFIGFLTWIALTLLGLPYALPLALIAAILEVVPTLGPILSAIPAVVVALTISPTTAIIVVGIYIGVQLLENNLLVPKIMEKAVGLNPVVIIITVMIGAKLMGVIGALLSIPFLSMLIIVFKNLQTDE